MKILADANMPLALEAFSTLGETTLLDGRLITPDDLRGVDLLFTRSTTKINAALLQHADRLKFYGSAVIGTDHIDIPLLARRDIPWSAAPGCNAESVAQYITTALLLIARRRNFRLRGKTLGLIGAGNVGKKIIPKARALGLKILISDPPRQRDPSDPDAQNFLPLSDILPQADILSFHVPLINGARVFNPSLENELKDGLKTRAPLDPTHHLLNAQNLPLLKPACILLNAARGPVIDNTALLAHLRARPETLCVLDTWEGEPRCNPELLPHLQFATPHIAGHSYEGKLNGTRLVYLAACRHLNIAPSFDFPLPPPPCPEFHANAADYADPEDLLHDLCLATYDLPADDTAFRASFDSPDPVKTFDLLRADYPYRREFSATTPHIANATPALLDTLCQLGFSTIGHA